MSRSRESLNYSYTALDSSSQSDSDRKNGDFSSQSSVGSAEGESPYSLGANEGDTTPWQARCTKIDKAIDLEFVTSVSDVHEVRSENADNDSVFADADRQSTGGSSHSSESAVDTKDAAATGAMERRGHFSSSSSSYDTAGVTRQPSLYAMSPVPSHSCVNPPTKQQHRHHHPQKLVRSKSATVPDSVHCKDSRYRDSIASRIRMEHSRAPAPDPGPPPMDYLTPLQKKEQLIKDLKAELKSAQNQLVAMETEREKRAKEIEDSWRECVDRKDREVEDLKTRLERVDQEKAGLEEKSDGLGKRVDELEALVQDLKDTMQRREEETERIYFKMYEKGKASAEFERFDEVEKLASDAPQTVSDQEILRKLKHTERQLERWQSLKRDEIYKNGNHDPVSDAEVKVRFMKDSMFHFLTDPKDRLQHLRAMVNIFDYTDVQNQVIAEALKKKNIDILNSNFVK